MDEFVKLQQPIRLCQAHKKGQCKYGDECKFLHVANSKAALQATIERATLGGFQVADVTYKAAGLNVPPEVILKRVQELNAQGMAKLEAIVAIIDRMEQALGRRES